MRSACLLVLAATACQGDARYFGTTAPRHGPDELWINNASEPEWVDPGKCSDMPGGEIIMNSFAGLVQHHPQTLAPMPDLAERWEKSPDGKTYTFHLRQSAWSDGTPVTAEDFAWSWKRVLDPETASKYATYFYVLEGAADFHQKKAGPEAVGVRAIDARTLEVKLAQPVPYFLDMLHYYTAMPVPRHVIERLRSEGKNPDLWTRPEHWVSNGPYVVSEWKFRQYIVLEKNPHYWDQASVKTQRIRLSMVESYHTALNLYRAGEIDWIGTNTNLPAEFKDHLKRFEDFTSTPYMTVYWYWLNTKKPPLDNPKVRRALSLAVDREAIVRHVKRSGEIPTADVVPEGLAGYAGPKSPIFAPDEARRLLAEAGFPDGKGFPQIALSYNTSEGHRQLAEAVQQMWKKQLGIDVRLENLEWKVFLKKLELGDFDIARLGWAGDYPDPTTFLEVFSPHSGNNHSGWKSEAYGALLERANAEPDAQSRLGVLRQAEELIAEATPVVSLYVYARDYLKKPYVLGLWPNYRDRHPFKYLSIDRRYYDGVPETRADDPPPGGG